MWFWSAPSQRSNAESYFTFWSIFSCTNIVFNEFHLLSCATHPLKYIPLWASHHSRRHTFNSAETCSVTGKECEPVDSDIEDTLFTANPLIRTVWPPTFGEYNPRTSSGQRAEEKRTNLWAVIKGHRKLRGRLNTQSWYKWRRRCQSDGRKKLWKVLRGHKS